MFKKTKNEQKRESNLYLIKREIPERCKTKNFKALCKEFCIDDVSNSFCIKAEGDHHIRFYTQEQNGEKIN